jgi:PEP-CTERM motif-containing protein
MRYVLLVLATLFAIDVSSARADPLAIFQVTDATMFMVPNRGDGNLRFRFTGPGLDVEGFGGMACFSWCSGDAIPLDGPTPLAQIFVGNFGKAVLGGVDYSPDDFGMGQPGFFDASGGLNPIATGFFGSGETFSFFRMLMPTGDWSLNFKPALDDNGNPARRFVNGTFSASAPTPTPEPATFGLVFAGSAAIGWITRRRRKFRNAWPAR